MSLKRTKKSINESQKVFCGMSSYVFLGMIALFWCLLWFFFVRESPLYDPWVSEAEKNYILESIGPTLKANKLVVPWRCMLTSAPVWAIVAAHFSENWGFYTLLTELPNFSFDMFHMQIEYGLIASLPYLLMVIAVPSSGFLADWLRSGRLSTMQLWILRKPSSYMDFAIPLASKMQASVLKTPRNQM